MTYLLCPDHRVTAAVLLPDQLNQSLRIATEILMAHNMDTGIAAIADKPFKQLWFDRKENFFVEELKRYFSALSSEWTRRLSDDSHMQKYMSKGVMKNVPKQLNAAHPAVAQFTKSLQRLRNHKLSPASCEWPEEVFLSHRCKVLRDDYAHTHLRFAVNELNIPEMWQVYPFYHGTPRSKA